MKCKWCDGSGSEKCADCDGHGKNCPSCGGDGWVACGACLGTGMEIEDDYDEEADEWRPLVKIF
jgi:hypothetical protein